MIEKLLNKYKIINEKIIDKLKNDLEVDELFKEKEKIIMQLIDSGNYKLEDVKTCFLNLNLNNSDKALKKAIQNSMIEVKNDIKELHNSKNANNSYNNNVYSNRFFSTKV